MRRLRVLMVTQSYHPHWGGIGEHVRHLALSLAARGHDAAVLAPGPVPSGGELPGPRVYRVGRSMTVPSNGTRARIGWSAGYRFALPPILGLDWDVIHVHSPFEPFLPWAVLTMAVAPCVATFHNAGAPHAGYRYFGRGLRPLNDRLAVRIAVSPSAVRFVERHFPGVYTIVPNGIDVDRFKPGAVRARREARVLCVGRLEPRKGVDVLLRAAARLREGGVRASLVVVGNGSRGDALRRLARSLDVRVVWLGDVPASSIPAVYRGADVLAAPARYGESFGIVLLEALATGLPVVAAGNEGYRDLLRGCGSAAIVEPGDPEALAGAIAAALARPDRETVARAARVHAARYAWDPIAARVERLYEGVLDGAALGAREARGAGPIERRATVPGALARSAPPW